MNKILAFLVSFLMICFAHMIPISYIVGSYGSFFSATTIAAVLISKYSSLWSLVLFLFHLKKCSFIHFLYFLIKRMPLFFSAWSYKSGHVMVEIFIPLFCMILFMLHPIGACAWLYTTYWLIPLLLHFNKNKNLFLKALSAVFVAHSVGSVIWLYTHEMQSEIWLNLIPVVAIERFLMAITITVFDIMTQKIIIYFKNKQFFFDKEVA